MIKKYNTPLVRGEWIFMSEADYSHVNGGPVRVFKKMFDIKHVISTSIKLTCLGCCQIKVNSILIDNSKFFPGWTEYNKTVYYKVYDITSYLKIGNNEITINLVDGWYSGYVGYGYKSKIPGISGVYGKHYWGIFPRFRLDLIEGDAPISSGLDWKCQISKIINSDILMGEFHDNRNCNQVWDEVLVYFDTSYREELPHSHPSIVEMRTIDASDIGGNVYDLGENIAGYVSILANGNINDKITVKHSEVLSSNGLLDCRNLRTAKATDTYILKGGFEKLEPSFTYHGFRYIHINADCDILKVSGVVISTDIEYYDIKLSDKNANKLLENIKRTQQSNFMDIPTDCPQRDERMGWCADIHIYLNTAMKISNCELFITKWLRDLNDSQSNTGEYPVFAPTPFIRSFEKSAAGWSDAGVIVPYLLHDEYGTDVSPYLDNMNKYMNWRFSRDPNLIGQNDVGNFSDWLGMEDTPCNYIDLCFHYYDCHLMEKLSNLYGDIELEKLYNNRKGKITTNFKLIYLKDGEITVKSQTAYVLAIYFGLVDGKYTERLANLIERDGNILTGFLGTAYIMDVLSDNGYHDVALRLFSGENSRWLQPLGRGATTIWERWDSDSSDETMNSYSHFAFGSIGHWMIKHLSHKTN